MVIVINTFVDHGDGEIYVMTWLAFVCFDIHLSYPIQLGISFRLAIWRHALSCKKKPLCDVTFGLDLL